MDRQYTSVKVKILNLVEQKRLTFALQNTFFLNCLQSTLPTYWTVTRTINHRIFFGI